MPSFSFSDCSNDSCSFFDRNQEKNCAYVDKDGHPLFYVCVDYKPVQPMKVVEKDL